LVKGKADFRHWYDSPGNTNELHFLGTCKVFTFDVHSKKSFAFNFLIKRRWPGWWTKYNYVLVFHSMISLTLCLLVWISVWQSAPSSFSLYISGVDECSLQAFTYNDVNFPNWWGTTVIKNTADVLGIPFKILEPG